MKSYEDLARQEMREWQRDMQRRPGIFAAMTGGIQRRINNVIPDKVHNAITAAFKVVTKFMLSGADFLTRKPLQEGSLQQREDEVRQKINTYKNAATAEGALTGAGGILLGLADLPLWLTIKIKMLSHIAALYGYDAGAYHERLYILYTLSAAFSGRKHRRKVYAILADWDNYVKHLPEQKEDFDWRTFQQEYRDYLDLAKLLQLVPGIGAAVGAYVNNKHTDRLGDVAMNAYRMRWFATA